MPLQLSIIGFIRSQRNAVFLSQMCLELGAARIEEFFCKEKKDSSLKPHFFLKTPRWEAAAADKDWIPACPSPSPLQALPAGLPAPQPPPPAAPLVRHCLGLCGLMSTPQKQHCVGCNGPCWGLCGSRLISPSKIPRANKKRKGQGVLSFISEAQVEYVRWHCEKTTMWSVSTSVIDVTVKRGTMQKF